MTTDKPRMTATERDALLGMNVALCILAKAPEQLAKRAKLIPNAARDLGLIKGRITHIMEGMAGTIPANQLQSYLNTLKGSSYIVGCKSPAAGTNDTKNYGTWLSYDTIYELMGGCHDRCMLCELDKGEQRACKLRKAFDTIPNDTKEREDGKCPYYGLI